MKDLKEKNIEFLIVQKGNEFTVFPEDDARIKAYKRIFTILKEALQFSGLPLTGVDLRYNDNYFSIFEKDNVFYSALSSREISLDELLNILKEEKKAPPEKKPEKVKEKPVPEVKKSKAPPEEDIKVSPEIFEKIKEITEDYLGAFAITIYENQLKDSKIKPEEATLKKTKRFILNLQKAASMIIGPSQSKEMGSKLLKLLP